MHYEPDDLTGNSFRIFAVCKSCVLFLVKFNVCVKTNKYLCDHVGVLLFHTLLFILLLRSVSLVCEMSLRLCAVAKNGKLSKTSVCLAAAIFMALE